MSQHFKEIMSVYISNTMYKYIITIITQTSIFLKKLNKTRKVNHVRSVFWLKDIALLLLCQCELFHGWSGGGKSTSKKKKWKEKSTVLLVPSIISVCVSNHVCSSCSSTFRAKIHWNVLVLSAVYRKLLQNDK